MSLPRWTALVLGTSAVPAVYLGLSPWGPVVLALAFLAAAEAREYSEARRQLTAQLQPLYAAVERLEARVKADEDALEAMGKRLKDFEQQHAQVAPRLQQLEQRIFGSMFPGGPPR